MCKFDSRQILWISSSAPTRTCVMMPCQMECRLASRAVNSFASAEPGNAWRQSLRRGLVKPLHASKSCVRLAYSHSSRLAPNLMMGLKWQCL